MNKTSEMSDFEITFLGVTGSCAFNNGSRAKHGSNTICAAVKVAGETIVFDMGTGVCGLSALPGYRRDKMSVFFTHYHLDHVCGILFCKEFFDKRKVFDIYGPDLGAPDGDAGSAGPAALFKSFLSPPVHPLTLDELDATLNFHTIAAGDIIELPGGVEVCTCGLSHPGGALGYRVGYGNRSVCYISDVELKNYRGDSMLPEFIKDTDILVLDCFFCGETIPGWGHSNPRECADLAKRAGVKKLVLFHLDYMATDTEIDAMQREACGIFPETLAAHDGMVLRIES